MNRGYSAATHKKGGFGLLEVLISMLLISFSVLGLSTLQMNMLRSARFSQSQLAALYIAESRMEQMRLNREAIGDNNDIGYQEATDGEYLIVSSVTNHSSINTLALIEVTVSWRDLQGRHGDITLHSALFKDRK